MSVILNHVSKTFVTGFSKKKVKAVIDLNLIMEKGSVFGIIGPNGAGKSTVLKMLMGFIPPTSGEISILGSSPEDPRVRFDIGYLPENPYYYDHLSAEELMRFGALTSGWERRKTEKSINRMLKLLDLEHARKRKLRGYSKGMTQRAGICFALVHDPQLVILDEPMSGLDPLGRRLVVDLILNLKSEGKTVLFCSHILTDVERLCDRMAIMDKGRLKLVMAREDLLKQHRQMILMVPELPGSLEPVLKQHQMSAEKRDGEWRILCPRSRLTEVLNILKTHGVKDPGVDTTSYALENMFLNTIDRRS